MLCTWMWDLSSEFTINKTFFFFNFIQCSLMRKKGVWLFSQSCIWRWLFFHCVNHENCDSLSRTGIFIRIPLTIYLSFSPFFHLMFFLHSLPPQYCFLLQLLDFVTHLLYLSSSTALHIFSTFHFLFFFLSLPLPCHCFLGLIMLICWLEKKMVTDTKK